MIFLYLVFIVLSQHIIECHNLNCNFNYGITEKSCCVTLDVFDRNISIASISVREFIKPSEILTFKVPRESQTEFIPLNFCKQFLSLQEILICGEKVKEISSLSFNGCNRVMQLSVIGTQISELSSDSFNELTSMQVLNLSNNRIKMLPMNLLSRDSALTHFYATSNELEIIEIQFSDDLKTVNLSMNNCIDDVANTKQEIKKLNAKIKINCLSSTQTKCGIIESDKSNDKLNSTLSESTIKQVSFFN